MPRSSTRKHQRAVEADVRQAHERTVDADVRKAVAAWQRAHLTPLQLTQRKDAANRRLRDRAVTALDRIVDEPSLLPAERTALIRTMRPFRLTVESIFYAPTNQPHRPTVRAEGYQILAARVRQLTAAGLSENAAVRFVVDRLVTIFPPERTATWLYDVERAQDVPATLENRLSTFLAKPARPRPQNGKRG